MIQTIVHNWIELANKNDYKSLLIDTAKKSYSDRYFKSHRFLYPILSRIGKPKDFNRFLIQANSCITHNSYGELEKILCPTLIVGGDNDKVVSSSSLTEMATKIQNSELHIYEGLGHAVYEEAKDFNFKVLDFLGR